MLLRCCCLWVRRRKVQWEQRATLVNVKIKWVKDRYLDSVVAREHHLQPAHHLIHLLSSSSNNNNTTSNIHQILSMPIPSSLRSSSGGAALTFLRRYPTLYNNNNNCFSLTDAALQLRHRELQVLEDMEGELVNRVRRLLMLTLPPNHALPLHTLDLLRWDLGLPLDYHHSFLPRYPQFFQLFRPPQDDRTWLRLLSWDRTLAISHLHKNDKNATCFPVRFTRGFGLSNKCMSWLKEWQSLPYTSPYAHASSIDPRTDLSEKRNVGVFHELLHLTIANKTERRNVSNMRKLLGMPQKFTKLFDRHPGIFYLSHKLATHTVVLREAYGSRGELLVKHPLVAIREEYAAMMRAALPPRRRTRSWLRQAPCSDPDDQDEGPEEEGLS